MYNLDFGCAAGTASAPAVEDSDGSEPASGLDGKQEFLQEVRLLISTGRVPTREVEMTEESSAACSDGVCAVTWKPVRK